MMAPDLDLLGIYVPTPAMAIAIVFVLFFFMRRVLDKWLHGWPFGGRIWHIGLIQICVYAICLGGLLWLFNGPASTSLSAVMSEWWQQLTSVLGDSVIS